MCSTKSDLGPTSKASHLTAGSGIIRGRRHGAHIPFHDQGSGERLTACTFGTDALPMQSITHKRADMPRPFSRLESGPARV